MHAGKSSRPPNAAAKLVLAATCWGISWPLTKCATERIDALDVALVGLVGSAISLAAFRGICKHPPISSQVRRVARLTGAIEPGAATLLFVVGVSLTTASASALIDALQSIGVAVFSSIFLGERIQRARWLTVAGGMVGVALALRPDTPHREQAILGDFLVFCGMLLASSYVVFVGRIESDVDALSFTYEQALGAVVFAGVAVIVLHGSGVISMARFDLHYIALPFVIGVIANAVPFYLFTSALQSTAASAAASYLALIPIVAVLAAAVGLGEHLDWWQLSGAFLAVTCVGLAARRHSVGTQERSRVQ